MNTTQKTPSLLIGNDFVTVVLNGKPFTIYKNDMRFPQVLAAVKSRSWETLDKLLDTAKAIGQYTVGNVHIVDGVVSYGNSPLHNSLVTKLLDFMREGFPYEPLAKFLDKLMQNPSHSSVECLYNWIEKYKLPICEDGDFLAYKAVTSEFKDKYTETVDNSVGQKPEMPRNWVDDNNNVNCSKGYHIGDWNAYVNSFANDTDNIIICKVNPRDVVSLPSDASCSKMRVCRYEVISCAGQKSKVTEFQSDYVAKNKEDAYNDEDDGDDTHDYTFDEQVTDTGLNSDAEKIIVNNTTAISTSPRVAIGANQAYKLYKDGENVYLSSQIINPDANLSRQYFRDRAGKWTRDAKDFDKQSDPAVTIYAKPKVTIGSNKAYRLYKDGINVYSADGITFGKMTSQGHSRNFFRARKGWTVDAKYANY